MERADRTQTGKVIDDEGKPVTWATVRAYVGDEITTTTDAEGKFELKGLPGSEIRLSVREGDLRGSANASKDTESVTIKLEKRT